MVEDPPRRMVLVIVQVDPSAAMPVYEQLRTQITRLVVSGQLAAGTQLPTIRQLAADLDLAKDTVARTYELLERDHLVERRGRHGTTVTAMRPTPASNVDADLATAASEFALVARQLGVDPNHACRAVRAAMTQLT